MKKTKIICSIGPASYDPDVIEQMVLKGMNVARINLSHATEEEEQKVLDAIEEVRKRTDKNIGILWDTKGPEFRTGKVEDEEIELVEGKTIRFVKDEVIGDADRISVNHPEALDNIEVGSEIYLENAIMKLEVISKEADGITCEIINGGPLGDNKSISVPGIKLDIPYISKADKKDFKYICEHGGDFIACSFVSTKEDILQVKELLKEYGNENFQLIAKVESELGIKNLQEILEVSDGVMVARGDLGNEVPSERLPIVQKAMIKQARRLGKICIVATEMLETMMENIRPKRAETSDIANAVLDGTDAVMLSGETTIGKHPIEAVEAMADVCETTEQYAKFHYSNKLEHFDTVPGAIAQSIVDCSNHIEVKAIGASTITGQTAKLISNIKPDCPVIALVTDYKVACGLSLCWGVETIVVPMYDSTDEILTESEKKIKDYLNLESGDKIIITGNFPITETPQPTNLMKISEIQ